MFSVLLSNGSYGYGMQCAKCQAALDAGDQSLSSSKTFLFGVIYAAIGWFILLVQMLILGNISRFV